MSSEICKGTARITNLLTELEENGYNDLAM
jgi:hypothetical protein